MLGSSCNAVHDGEILRQPPLPGLDPPAAGQRQRIEGLFVEIYGMTALIEPEASHKTRSPGAEPIEANGKRGRVIYYIQTQRKYVVHTFDAFWLCIPEVNLSVWTPSRPKDGGFDVCWPSQPQDMPMFSVEVLTNLARQGYVLVETIVSDERRSGALKMAKNLTGFTMPKEELVQDFLGRGGRAKVTVYRAARDLSTRTKIAALQANVSAPKTSPYGVFEDSFLGGRTRPGAAGLEGLHLNPLERCCLELTNVFALLRPITDDALGIDCHTLSEELVWLPFDNRAEEAELSQGRLVDADVQSGQLEEHLVFIQRRKLCMFYLVCGAGDISLYPKEELGMRSVTIPVTRSKLLIFRHDFMSFTFMPRDKEPFLVLQAWSLEAPQQLELTEITGDPVSRSRIRGLMRGPVEPPGSQVNIKSLASRLPGSGVGVMKYWTMLTQGCDAQVRIPHQRFDVTEYCSLDGDPVEGKSTTIHGGFCSNKNIFFFDNALFGIEDEEVMHIAPAQRIVMETGFECLELAGFSKDALEGCKCGVFVGDCGSDWFPHLVNDTSRFAPQHESLGFCNYCTAARVSHTLSMTGPTFTVDTACSSSLVATGLAMSRLRQALGTRQQDGMLSENLQEALVLGVGTIVSPHFYVTLSAPLMLSKKGRCFTFDSSGDGYERGEGCGAFFLGIGTFGVDRLAILVGSAINQDGRSATLTAPNGPSQQVCIWKSLLRAAIAPTEVSIAECHGIGTSLGDPIEVGALRKVMEPRERPLLCTSSKSNIGHLEAGAGVAGFVKLLLMLVSSSGPPNCHLRTINPHLGHEGLPAHFETEAVDTSSNSGLAGVSSFGFGGTNARADMWAECRLGPRSTGDFDTARLDQVHVTCPITMGPIDYLTGEPARTGVGKTYHADTLRDEFAYYDVSSHVYSGSYRFRNKPLYEDSEVTLGPKVKVCVRGTWTGWKVMEEMQLQMDGWYNCIIVLGESRYELFNLCLDGDRRQEIYPAVNNAPEIIWICGPDSQRKGRTWMIDGRDEEVPAGTPFRIRFKWGEERKLLIWDRAPSDVAKGVPIFQHVYSVVGTWTHWEPEDLTQLSDDEGTWECHLRIGLNEVEDFQFVRDHDFKQMIYPAKPCTTKMSIPVRGPDELGHDKNWRIRGPVGDNVNIRLRVVDAQVTVTLISDTKGTKVWQSEQGWNRREYFLAGNFNGWLCTPMTMDPVRPGIFKAVGCVGDKYDIIKIGYLAEFQIVIDEDFGRVYYPELNGAGSGECIVRGPDGNGTGRHFLVRTSCMPSRAFEVALDLTSMDRRKIVTWTLVVDERDAAPDIE
uniref:Type I polyketide synthase n=1 Tax=Gambierdiscus polynesiensis TaxID=439318 RepID=A0A1S6K7Z4_9DINO|nr:type I polyketide synthase [Gambierdiscus polynesiensis]